MRYRIGSGSAAARGAEDLDSTISMRHQYVYQTFLIVKNEMHITMQTGGICIEIWQMKKLTIIGISEKPWSNLEQTSNL